MLRILTGLWTTGYLALRLPAFLGLAQADRRAFNPVGVLSLMRSPVPGPLVTTAVFVTLALAVAYTAGIWFRVSGPVFAIALLTLATYRSSWGQVLWFETLVVVHVLIVGFAPSADALAVGRGRTPWGSSRAYGAPVRLAAVVTVATYLLSGMAKLRIGGLGWMSSETLRNHIAYSAARLDILGSTPSPLAPWLVTHPWLLTPIAMGTMVLELGAPLALVGGWVRTAWVASVWLLHIGIAISLFVVWGYPLWGVAFAPLFPLERIAARVRSHRIRRHSHPSSVHNSLRSPP